MTAVDEIFVASRNGSIMNSPLIQYQNKWVKQCACQGILWNIRGHCQEKLSSTYKISVLDILLECLSAGEGGFTVLKK